MQPFLIRVLERCRQRRHDLAAITEVAPNLSPLLLLADTLKATSRLDSLLELVKIERSLIDARKASKTVTMLLVEFSELVKVIQIGT